MAKSPLVLTEVVVVEGVGGEVDLSLRSVARLRAMATRASARSTPVVDQPCSARKRGVAALAHAEVGSCFWLLADGVGEKGSGLGPQVTKLIGGRFTGPLPASGESLVRRMAGRSLTASGSLCGPLLRSEFTTRYNQVVVGKSMGPTSLAFQKSTCWANRRSTKRII